MLVTALAVLAGTLPAGPATCEQKYDGPQEVKCYIRRAATRYGQSQSRALAAAWCESRFQTRASNGPYKGIYQFNWTTWINGKWGPGHSRFNPKYAALNAMWYWHKGEYSRWPVCAYRVRSAGT